jgi:hypothetical protein
MRQRLHPRLNALHVMAILIRWGCSRPRARRFARVWERLTHPWLSRVSYPGPVQRPRHLPRSRTPGTPRCPHSPPRLR